MKARKSDRRYISILTVHVPSAAALVDMLRYDSCCPSTQEDSAKIERLMGHHGEAIDHVVRLRRYAGADLPATEGRWRSFGCRVLDERHPDQVPLTDIEALNLVAVEVTK